MDIPCGPLVVDYAKHLTDTRKVTNYISGKNTNKDYNIKIIYLLLVLPLTKKCSVIEGPLEDPGCEYISIIRTGRMVLSRARA